MPGGPAFPEDWLDARVGCYGVVTRAAPGGTELLLVHWNEAGRRGWILPGGGMEGHERPEETTVRELREETGHEVRVTGLLGVDVVYVPAASRLHGGSGGDLRALRVLHGVEITGGSLRTEVGGTTDAVRWVPLAEVPDLERTSLVDVAVDLLGPA